MKGREKEVTYRNEGEQSEGMEGDKVREWRERERGRGRGGRGEELASYKEEGSTAKQGGL